MIKTLSCIVLSALCIGTPAQCAPRIVEYITGDRSHPNYRWDHGGRNYHEHFAFTSRYYRDMAANHLRRRGYFIGSMEGGRHAWGSYHYRGLAFDVPFYPNNLRFGYHDNRYGEEKFSYEVRQVLLNAQFTGITAYEPLYNSLPAFVTG